MLLNYQEFGQGRPILILHGLFGSARNWQGVAKVLSENYRVITPDLRNHGQSFHSDSMSYEEMADDVVTLIDDLKLEDCIVIGHSMGGKVVMTIALNQPDRFPALISVDIAPVAYTHNFIPLLNAMNALPLDSIKSRNEAEKHMAANIDNPVLVTFVLQNLIREGDGFAWRINLDTITRDIEKIIGFPGSLKDKTSRVPALFLGGTESNYILSIHNPAIYQHFPSAEITMIEGASHWVHADKPKVFLDKVESFIKYV